MDDAKATHCPAILVSALVATSALTVAAPPPAAANQIGDLKAQARAIAQKLVQEQLQVDAYQQQYSVEPQRSPPTRGA